MASHKQNHMAVLNYTDLIGLHFDQCCKKPEVLLQATETTCRDALIGTLGAFVLVSF